MFLTTYPDPAESGRPEAVFISWLLWQPRGADLAAEALKEIAKLSRHRRKHPDIERLRALFMTLAGGSKRPH